MSNDYHWHAVRDYLFITVAVLIQMKRATPSAGGGASLSSLTVAPIAGIWLHKSRRAGCS